jgi:hypothetical protein
VIFHGHQESEGVPSSSDNGLLERWRLFTDESLNHFYFSPFLFLIFCIRGVRMHVLNSSFMFNEEINQQ